MLEAEIVACAVFVSSRRSFFSLSEVAGRSSHFEVVFGFHGLVASR